MIETACLKLRFKFTQKQSAGILLYRHRNLNLEVLLVHPGGPFFQKKDLGVWSIPKGEFSDDEPARDAAVREFKEELGVSLSGEMIELTPLFKKAGKRYLPGPWRGMWILKRLLAIHL